MSFLHNKRILVTGAHGFLGRNVCRMINVLRPAELFTPRSAELDLRENGRTGLTVAGSSLVGVKDSALGGNRVAQLLNSERAQTELLNSVLDDRPGERLRIDGGHVLSDGDEVTP